MKAIFSVTNALLLQSVPVTEPDRLLPPRTSAERAVSASRGEGAVHRQHDDLGRGDDRVDAVGTGDIPDRGLAPRTFGTNVLHGRPERGRVEVSDEQGRAAARQCDV